MIIKNFVWKAMTKQERFWALENLAFRQWQARNQKGVKRVG